MDCKVTSRKNGLQSYVQEKHHDATHSKLAGDMMRGAIHRLLVCHRMRGANTGLQSAVVSVSD